jgi:GNAT superfamily N-acetyltransferase
MRPSSGTITPFSDVFIFAKSANELIITELSSADPPIRIRDLEPSDEAALLALFEAAEDYFVAATGQPAGPGDVQSLYYALPDGAAFEDKALLVVTAGERVVGVIDAVPHHPHPTACAVGLFLLHPKDRRRGLGRRVAEALFAELVRLGVTEVGAGVPAGWAPGQAFLIALGFTLDEARMPSNANRNSGPGEGRVIPARKLLWKRPIVHAGLVPAAIIRALGLEGHVAEGAATACGLPADDGRVRLWRRGR